MDNARGSSMPPYTPISSQTPPLPPSSPEIENPLELNPFSDGYHAFDNQVPPLTPTPEPEQDEEQFPSLDEFWAMIEQPRRENTPLPKYSPLEIKPPSYDCPADEHVHQGVWYCHNTLQLISWPEAKKLRSLDFSRWTDKGGGRSAMELGYLAVCPDCGFLWGASVPDETPGLRQWARNVVKKGIVKVLNGVFEKPNKGYEIGPGLMGCACGGTFANDWTYFRIVGEGRFDPIATSMRVLERLENEMPEGERVALY
ncbi:uncharacterized protein BDZ99DRAFT_570825 [Mytilinidion resinicola]|uniref:Uncharacterized protein n=1 Tax=Mytilinidion resinicola TaxID=574789 RepID=A0A6A6YQD3_9PEZI|nr:uncharacterized protein BDZ99DRAFT_570825 [Mytilinidion resinicola]KAF2810224.1 hypothetical protein BDZ99DRAFT_570825 [Mytilinidion resinicola]